MRGEVVAWRECKGGGGGGGLGTGGPMDRVWIAIPSQQRRERKRCRLFCRLALSQRMRWKNEHLGKEESEEGNVREIRCRGTGRERQAETEERVEDRLVPRKKGGGGGLRDVMFRR